MLVKDVVLEPGETRTLAAVFAYGDTWDDAEALLATFGDMSAVDAGFVPNVSYEPNEMQTILAYVAGGLGIALVPQSLSGFHPGAIAYRPLRGRRIRLELALLKRADDQSAPLKKFHALCSAVGEEYASQIRKSQP